MYVVSGDRNYYKQFVNEIKEISLIMDTIERENTNEKAFSSESFDALIRQKKLRTSQFIQLKRLSDSLINFSVAVDKDVEMINPQSKLFTARQFKSIVKIDTIKPSIKAQPKKKFFGRILAAINDKKSQSVDSSKSTFIKTIITADTSSLNLAYNKLQLKAINDYYLKLYRINKRIKDKEKQLLDVNHLLISTIVNGLKQYKTTEKDYYASVQHVPDIHRCSACDFAAKWAFYVPEASSSFIQSSEQLKDSNGGSVSLLGSLAVAPKSIALHEQVIDTADRNPPCNTLYVSNIPAETDENELISTFKAQSGYKRLCFRNKQNGPMCFVEFDDTASATKTMNELHG
ncbi:MAG: hypothetical protein EOO85_32740, partial [Pedobacter sp.]